MNNIKCAQCGLVNWSTAVECKRCEALLTVQDKLALQVHFETDEAKPLFSRPLKFLTAVLALATLALLFSRVIHLIDDQTATIFAVLFVLSGIALSLLTQVWMIVRIFQESVGWGLGALFIPLVGLIAIVMFWEKTRRSFLGHLICIGIVFAGYFILPPAVRAPGGSPY